MGNWNRSLRGTVSALAVWATLACEDPTGPRLASIVAALAGPEIDTSDLVLVVDGVTHPWAAAASSTTIRIAPGRHTLSLKGLPGQCSTPDGDSRTVTVASGEAVTVTFDVECAPTILRIEYSTTGVDIDPDGYYVSIEDNPAGVSTYQRLVIASTNGSTNVTLPAIAGSSTLFLTVTGTAPNCTLSGENPRLVVVSPGDTTSVMFSAECVPGFGTIVVNTVTTGTQLDPDGYTLTMGDSTTLSLSSTGSVRLEAVRVGGYVARLESIASNCKLKSQNPVFVNVRATETTTIGFTVDCSLESVTVSVTTTGTDIDLDGYALTVAWNDGWYCYYYDYCTIVRAVIPANGSRVVQLSNPGTYFVSIDDIALNCQPTGSSTVRFQFPAQAEVHFDIQCSPVTSIAYTSQALNRKSDIHAVDSNRTNDRALTSDPGSDSEASWSPDGTLVAFTSDRGGNEDIWVMNADGSNPVRLTFDAAADHDPSWSPDGQRIVFVSGRSGNADLWTMDANGGNPTRLTSDAAADVDPAWSPDGSMIAFASDRGGLRSIHIIDPDGANVRRVTTAPVQDGRPAWSPDSRALAYSRQICEAGRCQPWIVITDLDRPGQSSILPGDDPAWSPDGRFIAFTGWRCDAYFGGCGPARLTVVSIATRQSWVLTEGIASHPAWRR